MKRLLPALISLGLLLTSCPKPLPPVEISMDADPRALQGRWEGDLVEDALVQQVTSGGGRTFVLLGYGSNAQIMAIESNTGVLIKRLARPEAQSIAYRADGKLLILSGEKLFTYDAASLTELEERAWSGWWLSEDGMLSSNGSGTTQTRLSTLDGSAVTTFQSTAYVMGHSSDDAWWLAGERAVRASDGQSSGGTSAHGNPCNFTSQLVPTSIETVLPGSQAGTQYLLGWRDGFIERRAADGTLLGSYRANVGCLAITDLLLNVADRSFVWFATNGGTVGQLNLQTGQVTVLPSRADSSSWQLTREGAVGMQGITFQPWSGTAWNLPLAKQHLSLNVVSTVVAKDVAEVTGTSILTGRALTVTGKLHGHDVIMAQTSMVPPALIFDLKLLDGAEEVASLSGMNYVWGNTGAPNISPAVVYRTSLQVPGDPALYLGELRRP